MANCNEHRDTFGIIIGCAFTLLSFIIFILSVFSFFTDNEEYESMVIFLTSALISALFVVAIIKKLPHLIIPWLLLCAAVVFGSCRLMHAIYLFYLVDGRIDLSSKTALTIFIIAGGIIAIEIAITLYSFWLYLEILKENCSRRHVTSPNKSAGFTEISKKTFV